jgi:hypothetical protein
LLNFFIIVKTTVVIVLSGVDLNDLTLELAGSLLDVLVAS